MWRNTARDMAIQDAGGSRLCAEMLCQVFQSGAVSRVPVPDPELCPFQLPKKAAPPLSLSGGRKTLVGHKLGREGNRLSGPV